MRRERHFLNSACQLVTIVMGWPCAGTAGRRTKKCCRHERSRVQVFSPEGQYLGVIPPRNPISVAFASPGKKTLYIVGGGALGPDGKEFTTPAGVNAKTIDTIPMLAEGYRGRAK